MEEMERKQKELEASVMEQQAELDRLGDLERKLLEREARRKNIDSSAARVQDFKLNSQ